ncbi:GNAT family N-acetyltransferase [Flavobacterium sp.]|uniref:GNAT family N-acetyltransferase n=1 Tax=Flavobacterium sp. TaxID=239 RepID=UPI002606B1E9|nr:GNAT family N-acetyltransferase [Flavobacterium sp.]MDD3004210.1 GNAT family N-acetyltransferase [Flavobacterium sp.]
MIQFKPLNITDIDIIVPLMQDFYTIDDYPIDVAISKKLFHTFIENENLGQSWLISYNNEIVGYVILTYIFSFEYQGKIAFLDELYLNKQSQGKGIGKSTIDFIHAEALKNDIKIIYLEVEPHNKIAKKLYLSKDFLIHKRQLMKLTPKP